MLNATSTSLSLFLLFTLSMPANSAEKKEPVPKSILTIQGENPDDPSYVSTHYKDLDEDGVPDSQDQCLNTGKGYQVNNYGCELDSDEDGVFDRFDQCPRTPKGIHVNFLGCEPDEDKDKVLDSKDQCPGTPLGTTVDEHGCDNDHDKDGVLNPDDRCPETPPEKRAYVNKWGCNPEPLVITHIIFDTGSYAIREDQRPILEQDLSRLRLLMPDEVLVITGHTDNVGTDYRNLKLSWNRAQSTKDFFTKDFEVDDDRVYVRGKGESEPAWKNDTPENRQQNRRIELKIVKDTDIPRDAEMNIREDMKGYKRWEFRNPNRE